MPLATVNRPRRSRGLLSGTLGNKVSLQRRTSGKDALNQPTDVWTEYASVWGNVLMKSGKESIESGTQVSIGQASIRIRYRTDVTNGDRAICQGITFHIVSPLPSVSTQEYTDLVVTLNATEG